LNLQAKFYNRSVADTGIDGEGLSATASGATSRGANGEGALFDGSNDYALSDSWSLGGAFSMEAYVKLDSLPSHFAPIFNFAETPTVWDSVSYCGFVTSWSAASYSSCDLGQSTSYPQGCTMANCADIDDCIDECNSCGSLCEGIRFSSTGGGGIRCHMMASVTVGHNDYSADYSGSGWNLYVSEYAEECSNEHVRIGVEAGTNVSSASQPTERLRIHRLQYSTPVTLYADRMNDPF
jgi:hypothetical protein